MQNWLALTEQHQNKAQAVNGTTTWLAFLPVAPVQTSSTSLLVLAVITVIIALASLLMLCHLLFFHIYLLYKGMSTYEYIMNQRQLQSSRRQEEGHSQASTSNGAASQNLGPQNMPVCCSTLFSGKLRCQGRGRATGSRTDCSKIWCSNVFLLQMKPQSADGEDCADYGSQSTFEIIPGAAPVGWTVSMRRMERPSTEQNVDPIAQSPLGTSTAAAEVPRQCIH